LVNAALFALGAIALWATNALVGKLALALMPVQNVQLLQFAGAAAVFCVIRSRSSEAGGGPLLAAIALGILGLTGTMVFQYLAFAAGPIADVNIVAYSWPLLAALIVMIGNPVARSWRFAVLTAVGFAGAVLVIVQDGNGLRFSTMGMGHAWAILSALCMAVYSAAIGRIRCNQDIAHIAGALVGCAGAAFWVATTSTGWPSPTTVGFWLALYLGVGPIGLGYFLWARAMRKDPKGRTAGLGYLTPVLSATLLAFAGVQMGLLAVAGSFLVVVCSAATGIEAQRHASE
jgi:drug/metabolite transporter (DMT)-like permease